MAGDRMERVSFRMPKRLIEIAETMVESDDYPFENRSEVFRAGVVCVYNLHPGTTNIRSGGDEE